jgi:GNAT superfamily N-acetyltransferase
MIEVTNGRVDLDAVHRYLSEESYWAKGITREVMERSIEHSLPFSAFDGDQQVGFARVITDYATFAYIADVFVLPSHRGRGIARLLMTAITDHPKLQDLRRWSLVTRDAQALYAQFGFTPLDAPERHMMRRDDERPPAGRRGRQH